MLTLQRSREPVSLLRRVLASGPITALAACVASTQGYNFSGAARQSLPVDLLGPQGRKGSVHPLVLRRRCVTKPFHSLLSRYPGG